MRNAFYSGCYRFTLVYEQLDRFVRSQLSSYSIPLSGDKVYIRVC
jgi:hypothetical protein